MVGTVVVVIVWSLDLELPVQSVHITTLIKRNKYTVDVTSVV